MEESKEIGQLLEEIRDLQREYLEEYKRVTQQLLELNKTASEKAEAQYHASFKQARSAGWATFILIAVCFVANLMIMMNVNKATDTIRSVVTRAMERNP